MAIVRSSFTLGQKIKEVKTSQNHLCPQTHTLAMHIIHTDFNRNGQLNTNRIKRKKRETKKHKPNGNNHLHYTTLHCEG